jgi:hypothetical protein
MSVQTVMTALADEVRELSGETGQLSLEGMTDKVSESNGTISDQSDLIAQIAEALEGKAAGGGGLPTQEKTVSITANGTHEVLPDDGYALSKVTANVFVASDSERDVAALLDNSLVNLTNSVVTSLKSRALQGSTNLVTVDLPNVTTIGTYAFYACSGLVSVVLPKLTSVPSQAFYTCSKLKYADLGLTSSIAAQAFNANTALETMILRRTGSICTLSNANAISSTGIAQGKGYFYVPAALIESYKAGTYWSSYSARFRAIEDYPDICGGGA